MKTAQIILEMFRRYGVDTVFGLPGETTLPLYDAWRAYPDLRHVMARDERSSVFMAHGYARVSGRPGVCEGPSVGAPHMVPGLLEARKAALPLIALTTDIPLHMERRNMLTGFDQTALLASVVKESLTITRPEDAPFLVRRAFRLATSGRPGPVHLRLPMDVASQEGSPDDLYAQDAFRACPGVRSAAAQGDVEAAVELLKASSQGVIVAGQGAVTSGAWEELRLLAERFGLAVGTTLGGKGALAETHPLALGVVGSRGGTPFSHSVLAEADLIFFVGSSTDSAGTAGWTRPPRHGKARVIQLDVSEAELGNNYRADLFLLGDARETLAALLRASDPAERHPGMRRRERREEGLALRRKAFLREDAAEGCPQGAPVHPFRFLQALERRLPEGTTITVDPGISAIYPATYLRLKAPGRHFVSNFAMGALGFALPAALGASFADPGGPTVALSGDGSLGFCAGELETLGRTGAPVKLFVFDNGTFGWIRATNLFDLGTGEVMATTFSPTDHGRVAEGFGVPALTIATAEDVDSAVDEAFDRPGPMVVVVKVRSEERCLPPVPGWEKAQG
ncbi:MAG TPA: thiamine pyrophosphate-binding protein [Synergistaceae bacterium]|nr:thiamine pyrophosphate-binding protein [Synergistaceae bacterium]